MFYRRFETRKQLRNYYIIRGLISILTTFIIALVYTIVYFTVFPIKSLIAIVIILWALVPIAALEFILRYYCAVQAFGRDDSNESTSFVQTAAYPQQPNYPQQQYMPQQQPYYAQPTQQQQQQQQAPVVYSQQSYQQTDVDQKL
jgi:hypothetical protein